jgi:hypothetical protein
MVAVWYRRFAGGALLVYGLGALALGLIGLLSYLYLMSYPAAGALARYQLAGLALLLIGLPAIQLTQPQTGPLGWLGVGLMEVAAAVLFTSVLTFWLAGAEIAQVAQFLGALAGLAGDLLVGYLTARAGVFPAWAGLSLAAAGVVTFALGLTPPSTILGVITSLFAMLGGLAIAAYGWGITQRLRAELDQRLSG